MQISTLIGKPILSPDGTAHGYVTDVRLTRDLKKISCLRCADADEEEFYLPYRAVKSAEDAIIVSKARLETPTGVPSPIGRQAYSFTGGTLGRIVDLLPERETLLIRAEQTLLAVPLGCVSIAETAIVYPEKRKKRTEGRRSDPLPETPAPPEAPVPPLETPAPPKPDTPSPSEPEPKEPASPRGDVCNRTDLLGRDVRKNVCDATGTVIAAAGERVTPQVLSKARRAGRLLQLAVNTLTTQ